MAGVPGPKDEVEKSDKIQKKYGNLVKSIYHAANDRSKPSFEAHVDLGTGHFAKEDILGDEACSDQGQLLRLQERCK